MSADRNKPHGIQRINLLLASLGGIGYAPIAPATVASAIAAGLYWFVPRNALIQSLLLLLIIAIGVSTAGAAATVADQEDPSFVVIDELAGMLVACLMLPKTLLHLGLSFLFFRIFDIGKWFPMKQLERLPGGWGIVADDLAAGLLARGALFILTHTSWWPRA